MGACDITIVSLKMIALSLFPRFPSAFQSPMHIEGHSYPSVEHYYQACKLYTLGGARLAMQIRRIPDSGNVKVAARRLLRGVVDEEEIETWKREQAPVILHVSRAFL